MSELIDHLKSEHEEIKQIFTTYRDAPGDKVQELAKLLEHHTTVEEAVLYPNGRLFMEEETDHALKEHGEADELLAQLREDVENFELLDKLQKAIEHHVQEEETEYFPRCEEELSEEKLADMYDAAKTID